MKKVIVSGAIAAFVGFAAVALAGCDNGPSAVQTRDRAGEVADTALTLVGSPAEAATPSDAAPVKTAVTANRRETVDAKIARLYARNGDAFGARSAEDYLARMKAFTETPPSGVETVSRPNGDTLLYQASTNTFAVVSKDGVPRTMFKPDDGPTYWAQQKERAPDFGRRRTATSG